ncbi:hypothetical protein HK099_001933 [Clydaea vesicula]|uniref:UspA domain-containing protein n=1 Tax=Clydaea vesicula TaxID=447962 RepID=A0AAD5UAR0_9FUNG|nr:hypothetical protein HK099_001933 [Clydaea vesicula]KAJ3395543.1 hypothetical protein HDU92_005519 [Lobulomyces angularis]
MESKKQSKQVCFALDESKHSVHALSWVFVNLLKPGDKLNTIVIVDHEEDVEPTKSRAKTLLRAVWESHVVDVYMSLTVLTGKPGKQICNYVKEVSPDTLVLGSAGKTHVEGLMVGSVSNYCIANASCAVVVVRLTEKVEHRGRELTVEESDRIAKRSCSPYWFDEKHKV